MKKKVFSLVAACIALGFTACNNSSDNTGATNDSLNNTANAATSSGNYAARADSVKTNVSSGYYLNPRTGKAYTSLTVDPNSGSITDETGAPVRRYVDNRTWWVYDTDSWDTIGTAKMNNDHLLYLDQNGNWVDYDTRWTDDDMNNAGATDSKDNSGTKVSDDGNKVKDEHTKVKVSDKGDKVKVKKTDN